MLFRHVKRGTLHEVVAVHYSLNTFSDEGTLHEFIDGIGPEGPNHVVVEMQFSGEGKYAGPIVIYKDETGKYWLRPTHEFHDGRFELHKDIHS